MMLETIVRVIHVLKFIWKCIIYVLKTLHRGMLRLCELHEWNYAWEYVINIFAILGLILFILIILVLMGVI